MPSVGGVTVEYLSGTPTPVMQRVELFANAGQAGIGAQLMGQNQSQFTFAAFLYGAQNNVQSRLTSLGAVQGTVVSIEGDHGETYANCLVTSVGQPQRFTVDHEGSSKLVALVTVSGVRTGT